MSFGGEIMKKGERKTGENVQKKKSGRGTIRGEPCSCLPASLALSACSPKPNSLLPPSDPSLNIEYVTTENKF
jgi:hypothetical protein